MELVLEFPGSTSVTVKMNRGREKLPSGGLALSPDLLPSSTLPSSLTFYGFMFVDQGLSELQ